jgi:hypothetical protein
MRFSLWIVAVAFSVNTLGWTNLALAVSPAVPDPAPERPPVEEKLPPPPPAAVLDKITAPPASPVITTKSGYQVKVDRSQQVLSVYTPKEQDWISRDVTARQTVEVLNDNTPLQKGTAVLARLRKGRLLYVTSVQGEWAQTSVLSGGQRLTGFVAKKNLKPISEESPPDKSLRPSGEQFASAAALVQKGKQFDDGLYAAVELAMQNGIGDVTGKKTWLPRLAAKVDPSAGGTPLAQIYAALQLAGHEVSAPAALTRKLDAELQQFRADENRSKPLGFYTWSQPLEQIFRQDRMLQTPVDGGQNGPPLMAVAKQLAADADARASYERVLKLNERLTNKLTGPGYREALASLDAGEEPKFPSRVMVSFFPASRSPEGDLVMKLYGNRPIPPGFDLMKEVIARLKNGQLSFQPQPDSGWYDHQLWSIEPLVRFNTTDEAKRLRPNDEYRKHLEELFKGTYALMRETHVKQLEHPAPASEAPGRPKVEREKVYIAPDPHVELLPTMYLRRAESYRFVRNVLDDTLGAENVKQLHRQTARGPVEMNLADELALQEQLFAGAYVVACREIGMPEKLPESLGGEAAADEQAATFLRWVASLASDADLAPDARMMVPVFYDQQRRKMKVWVMLGWDGKYSSVGYDRQPKVTITDAEGKTVTDNTGPEVIFTASGRQLATPVFAELYVSKLLDRAEFRRHCDIYQSQAAILANLE